MAIMVERQLGKSSQDVAVTDALVTIFESGHIAERSHYVLWVENTGSKNITVANVEVSPDGITWFTRDTIKFTLAAGARDYLAFEDFPYARLQANCSLGESTTVNVGVTIIDIEN